MTRLLISGIAAVVAGVVLAGCGGGNDGSSAPAQSSGGGSTTLSAKPVGDAGTVLVDRSGKAVYASDVEMNGMAVCTTDSCEAFWKPLTLASGTPSGASLPGDVGVKQRPDGGRQVTYNGQLLYTFTEDGRGQVTGDGFSDTFDGTKFTWHVVHADSADDTTGGTGGGGLYGG